MRWVSQLRVAPFAQPTPVVTGTETHHGLPGPWNRSLTSHCSDEEADIQRVQPGVHIHTWVCVRNEAGLEPRASVSIKQRRQKVLPSPVQDLCVWKLLGVIDILGVFSLLLTSLQSAGPTWLPTLS